MRKKKTESMAGTAKDHRQLREKTGVYCVRRCHDSALAWPGAVILALTLSLSPATARAQGDKQDSLHISGQADSISSAGNGGGVGMAWFHALSSQSGLELGLFSFSLAESHWTYAKVGGYLRPGDKTSVYGELNLGPGRQMGKGFTYQIYKAGITQALLDKRFYVEGEEQYVRVGSSYESAVKTGTIFYPVPSLSCRLSYYFPIAGNVNSRFLSARFDMFKQLHYLAGFTVGRAAPVRFNLITDTNTAVPSKEFFGGLSIPVGKHELTLVLDTAQLPTVKKYTLFLNWKVPL